MESDKWEAGKPADAGGREGMVVKKNSIYKKRREGTLVRSIIGVRPVTLLYI